MARVIAPPLNTVGDISIATAGKLSSSRRSRSNVDGRPCRVVEKHRRRFAVSYKWHEELGRDSHYLYKRKSNQRETEGEKSSRIESPQPLCAAPGRSWIIHHRTARSPTLCIASIEITSSISGPWLSVGSL